MTRKRSAAVAASFQGRWRIVEMDVWDDEALHLAEPASLRIDGASGEMRFVAIRAWLDLRYGARSGSPLAEFSWEGTDDGTACSGRGWIEPGTAGRLIGHVFIHMGDDSGFVCEPC